MNLNLDKFSGDYVKNQMAAVTFEAAALIILAFSSFLFGLKFGENFFEFMPGIPSKVASGLFMVIFFDWAANRWSAKTIASGSSQQQLVTAGWMRWLSLSCSIIVSVTYFVISMSFIDVAGYRGGIGALSVVLVATVIIANGIGIYVYRSQSTENLEAQRRAEEDAANKAVEFENRKIISKVRLEGKVLATSAISKQVFKEILAQAPTLAKKETENIMSDWNREWDSYEQEINDDFKVSVTDPMDSNEYETMEPIDLSPTEYNDPRFVDGGKHDTEQRALRNDDTQHPPVPGTETRGK